MNEKFLDSAIKQRLYFDNVENRIVRDTVRLLKKLEEELVAKFLAKNPVDVGFTFVKKKKLLRQYIMDTRAMIEAGEKKLHKQWEPDFIDIGKVSAQFTQRELTENLPFSFETKTLAPAQVVAIVKVNPFVGKQLSSWVDELGKSATKRMTEQLRIGLQIGDPIPNMVRRIQSVADVSKNQAISVARTAISHINNEARTAVYKANSSVIKGEIYWTALDNRVSSICRPRHGAKFEFGKPYVLGGETIEIPAHIRCRCIWRPWLKTWEELGIKTKNEAVQGQTARFALIEAKKPGKPARGIDQGGRLKKVMRGTTSAAGDYYDWLAKQPDWVIIDIYGQKRFDLIKSGAIELRDLDKRGGGLWSMKKLRQKFDLPEEN